MAPMGKVRNVEYQSVGLESLWKTQTGLCRTGQERFFQLQASWPFRVFARFPHGSKGAKPAA